MGLINCKTAHRRGQKSVSVLWRGSSSLPVKYIIQQGIKPYTEEEQTIQWQIEKEKSNGWQNTTQKIKDSATQKPVRTGTQWLPLLLNDTNMIWCGIYGLYCGSCCIFCLHVFSFVAVMSYANFTWKRCSVLIFLTPICEVAQILFMFFSQLRQHNGVQHDCHIRCCNSTGATK